MIRFDYEWPGERIGNYRGCLEAKAEDGKFFCRVDCEVAEEPWVEIPQQLYETLAQFHRSGGVLRRTRCGERGAEMTDSTLQDSNPWFEVRGLLMSLRIRQHTPGHAEMDAGYCIDRACDFGYPE